MRKRLTATIAVVMVFCTLFLVPAQAYDYPDHYGYITSQSGSKYTGENVYHLGSELYWKEQIERDLFNASTRKEPRMGDADLDGRVTARDALFALYFGLYGNYQTAFVTANYRSPLANKLKPVFHSAEVTKETCLLYCRMNSPFFADVTKDCVVNAKDALEILKYAVGKAKDFPENDFTSCSFNFIYCPWPGEYYDGFHQDLYKDRDFPAATPTDVTPTEQ